MRYLINPAPLTGGTHAVPGDKSISHRALMLGAIGDGSMKVSGFLQGEDCRATLAALRAMGARIDTGDDPTTLEIHGVGTHGLTPPGTDLYLGNSGTGMRLLAGLLSGQSFSSSLTGDASLSRRPMRRVIEPLIRMGARIDSNDGLPPLRVRGQRRLSAIRYELPVASAQVKSAILLAALYADGETCVVERATTRDHTERMLQSLGVELHSVGGQVAIAGGQPLRSTDIAIPGDLSSASFLIVAALIAPQCELHLQNVGMNPTRNGVIEILRRMGARIDIDVREGSGFEPVADVHVRSSELKGIAVDPKLVPLAIDEFPVLFVAAAAARGTTTFSGIGELRVKESDRISAMADGLRKLGIQVDESPEGAVVHGGRFSGGCVDSFGDHRVAMALTVAGSIAAAAVTVLNTDAVDTSFPGFVDCARSAGLDVRAIDNELSEAPA